MYTCALSAGDFVQLLAYLRKFLRLTSAKRTEKRDDVGCTKSFLLNSSGHEARSKQPSVLIPVGPFTPTFAERARARGGATKSRGIKEDEEGGSGSIRAKNSVLN